MEIYYVGVGTLILLMLASCLGYLVKHKETKAGIISIISGIVSIFAIMNPQIQKFNFGFENGKFHGSFEKELKEKVETLENRSSVLEDFIIEKQIKSSLQDVWSNPDEISATDVAEKIQEIGITKGKKAYLIPLEENKEAAEWFAPKKLDTKKTWIYYTVDSKNNVDARIITPDSVKSLGKMKYDDEYFEKFKDAKSIEIVNYK